MIELTERQVAALTVLEDADCAIHPARVARLLDGPGRSGAGWRSTLDSLERLGLACGMYQPYASTGRVYVITIKGAEVLHG